MILEIILAILSILSLLGFFFLILRKIPALSSLPENNQPEESITVKIKRQMNHLPGSEALDYEVHLQKVLSKVRVLTLKTEQKTGTWLEKLRQKSNQKKNGQDNYWEELKKAKDGK
jgi:hypothetical protein